MKKLFSLILVLSFIFTSFNFTCAFANNNEIPLEEYASQLSVLTKQYGIDSIGGTSEDTETNPSEISLNRIIVKTNDNLPLANDCGAIAKVEGYDGLHIMQYAGEETTNQAYEYFSNLSNVEFVEFDFFFEILEPELEQETETFECDKEFLSWGSTTVCSNKAIACANSLAENAPTVIVAVIDSGIDYTHSFFEGRIDNKGVDLIENDGDPYDDYYKGHGTHVAGIVVDNTSENVKVRAYKTLNSKGGGYYSVTCAAIDLAVKNDVDVINMSLSWKNTEDCYNMFEESLQKAVENNVAVVVAAGNQYSDASTRCPASNNNVITVAATDENNEPASFSNYGNCVDVAAPGFSINSTMPENKQATKNGTSMASPFVAAAAAFIKSVNQNYTPDQIKTIVKETAFAPENWNEEYGIGILNLGNIVSYLSVSTPVLSFNPNNDVVITTSSSSAVVYYTTDGSDPVVGVSKIYDGPINTSSAVKIKAVAYERGKAPSDIAMLNIKWSKNIDIRYKGRKTVNSSYDIVKYTCSNEEIVSFDGKQIKGESIGEATVTIFYESGQRVTYNVTVDFAPFQWFHEIIYKLFGILLWSL